MKKTIIIIFLIFSIRLNAQNIIENDSIHQIYKYKKEINYFYKIDTVNYLINEYSYRKKEFYIYRNSIINDTLKSMSKILFDDYTKKYYLIEKTKNNSLLYKFDPIYGIKEFLIETNSKINYIYNNLYLFLDSVEIKSKTPIIDGYNQLKGYQETEKKYALGISKFNLANNKIENIVDFSNNLEQDNFISEILEHILLNNFVIFHTGYWVQDEINNHRYWGLDLKSLNYSELTLPTDYNETFYTFDTNREHFVVFKDNIHELFSIVFNNKFKNIGKILYRDNYSKGFYIKSSIRIGNYYKSFLDNGIKVLILDNINIDREIALYKIYNNYVINDFDNYNYQDLKILKGMILAKHNIKFKNQYFQAYFNLYRFYNSQEKRDNRINNVNHMLTKKDKENLKLIEKALFDKIKYKTNK